MLSPLSYPALTYIQIRLGGGGEGGAYIRPCHSVDTDSYMYIVLFDFKTFCAVLAPNSRSVNNAY